MPLLPSEFISAECTTLQFKIVNLTAPTACNIALSSTIHQHEWFPGVVDFLRFQGSVPPSANGSSQRTHTEIRDTAEIRELFQRTVDNGRDVVFRWLLRGCGPIVNDNAR